MKQPLLSNVGLRIGAATVLSSSLLDKHHENFPDGKSYAEAWAYACFNLLFIGPFLFQRLQVFVSCNNSIRKRLSNILQIVGLHSFLYGNIHRCLHKIPFMQKIHKFHHRFSEKKGNPVVPVIANAVSPYEFVVAYMFPFALGTVLLLPDNTSLTISVIIVSVCNLLVHAPNLSYVKKWVPFFVHPKSHLNHHDKKSPQYFAPTFEFY